MSSKAEYLQHGMLLRFSIAAAIVIVSVLAFDKTHAAKGDFDPKSGNGGKAPWEKTAGPPGLTVNVIYEVSSVVYAGTERQGVYKSTDNGLNWIAANNGIERTSISDMIVSGGNLLAANKSGCSSSLNVFKSTDGGVTWSGTTGLNGRIVKSFAIKGSFIYAASAFFPGSSGISRSSDNGNTWQEVASPITFNGNKIFVSDNAIILASENIIWRSLNDGVSWDPVEQFALAGISSFARVGTKLFAAGGLVIWTSLNNGGSWTSSVFSNGAYSFSSNGSTIYLGSRSKVFKSTDLGATWIDVSTGLGYGGIRALLYDGNNLFAGTPGDAAGMYRSTNGGTSWEPAPAGLPIGSEVRSMISLGGYLFAGMNGDGIYRSSDHGDTWAKTDIDNSLLAHEFVHTFCIKDNAFFAGATNGIYKSTDGGATFLRILNGFPANTNVSALSLTVSNGNIIGAVDVSLSPISALEAIFYSSDNGSNWHQANLPANADSVPAVASDGSFLAYAAVFAQPSSATGLYKSTDAGLTWVSRTATMGADIERLAVKGSNVLASTIFSAFYSTDFGESFAPSSPPHPPDICPGGCGIATYTLRGSSIFAGNQAGMFLSTDSGATWTAINEGFPVCPIPVVESSCSDNNYLFAGTASAGEGVWRKLLDPALPTPTPAPTATPGATPTPTPTPFATINISGNVAYCPGSPRPVQNVTLNLTGSTTASTMTNGSGNYMFSSLASGGTYTVAPMKGDLPPGLGTTGINTADALLVQKHFLSGGTLLTGCALAAARTNANNLGDPNTSDALFIQQFFLFSPNPLPGANRSGQWRFSPVNRTYPGVNGNQTGQNYDAYALGDVNGDLTIPVGPSDLPTMPMRVSVPVAVAKVALPNVDASLGDFVAAVTTSNIAVGDKLVAFQGDFTFDSSVVTFQSTPMA